MSSTARQSSHLTDLAILRQVFMLKEESKAGSANPFSTALMQGRRQHKNSTGREASLRLIHLIDLIIV